MRFRLNAFVCLALWTAAVPFAGAQQPQVPFLSVTTLQSGNTIARSVRTMEKDATQLSKEVSRAGAVRIVLRSFSAPKTPYEVQCFFSAKDAKKNRYIFDVKKKSSSAVFDEIRIYSRELFGGSEKVDETTTTQHVTWSDPYGNGGVSSGYAPVKVYLTSAIPGSSFEGWIVRILSESKVVRTEASVQELKLIAEKETAMLDKLAAEAIGR
jgi:hypothetical protein